MKTGKHLTQMPKHHQTNKTKLCRHKSKQCCPHSNSFLSSNCAPIENARASTTNRKTNAISLFLSLSLYLSLFLSLSLSHSLTLSLSYIFFKCCRFPSMSKYFILLIALVCVFVCGCINIVKFLWFVCGKVVYPQMHSICKTHVFCIHFITYSSLKRSLSHL